MTRENCANHREVFHDVILEVSEDEDAALGYDHEGLNDYFFRSYPTSTSQHVPGRGLARYSAALKHLLPFRRNQKKKNAIEVDSAGLFSFASFSWMSRYVYQAYRKGLCFDDIPSCSPHDCGDLNAQRLGMLWQAELDNRGPENASFGRAVWKFLQTRLLICSSIYIISCMLGFISPAIFMRKLIEFSEDQEFDTARGLTWAFAFTFSELLRMMSLALYYSLSYRTAIRLRAACLVLVFKKIMHLQTLGSKSVGEVINMFGSDGGRLFYMVVFGPMVIGGPIVVICCAGYIYFILGGWALLGLTTLIVFYPLQYLLSRLNGYFREQTVRKTDERIRLITEILNTIKLIKIYSWDVCFMKRLQAVRNEELSLLQRGSYCQSIGTSLAPTIPVITGILIFIVHVLSGGNLTAAQAFPVFAILWKCLNWSADKIQQRHNTLFNGYKSILRFERYFMSGNICSNDYPQIRMSYVCRCVTLVVHFDGLKAPWTTKSVTWNLMRRILESIIKNIKSIGSPAFPRQAYPLVTLLYSQLRGSLLNLRYGSENIIDGQITFGRIQEMLALEEVASPVNEPVDKTMALTINEGVFRWSETGEIMKNTIDSKKENDVELEKLNSKKDAQSFTLDSINLCISKGSLIGICGVVGSGKSSLLQACLGQMKKISGEFHRAGRSAYVSQDSWIENTTFKENILFRETFDPKKYIDALYCCALNEDVNALPAGDETEIGERGVNLSGGQKQRLSLARALYANRDIYFLDDPLSAVDSQVASHIFEKCILHALKKKTVFLVTHQTRFLQKCDEILVMKDGKIVERGTHHELLSIGREYCYMVESSTLISLQSTPDVEIKHEDEVEVEEKLNEKNHTEKSNSLPPKKYTPSEEQVRGEIRTSAYEAYIKSAGGYFICFVVFMSIFVNVGSTSFSTWWLAIWLKAGSGNATVFDPETNDTVISPYVNDNPDLHFYIQMYACIIGLICATSLLRGVTFTKVTIRASRILHNNYLERLISSRLRYFEVTPIGRIQNIFSRDFNEIDSRLPGSMETMIQNLWVVMFAFLFITMVFPWFLLALIVLGILYYLVGKIFRVAIRDLKRIEAISRAPIFSLLSATINGLPIIHAFGKEREYLSQFYQKYDENSVCTYMTSCAMRWMAIRLDIISVAIVLITSMLVLLLKGEVSPALAGLALSYSSHISGVFQYTLRLMSETEARFISVERIYLTTQKLVSESNEKGTKEVSKNWPSNGSIKFENVRLSYSDDLPPVLNDITFAVNGGEKIGIVGRTGAGKSSLVAAIFRLVELSQGTVFIDGVDISSVRLEVLRSRLSVIPQDPVVFSGTLRFNLDPFGKYSDDVIWEVLKQTKLIGKIQSMANGLSTLVGEGGDNLSTGESQLLCLARALLRGSKVLILDEATASVDPDTETAVQTTLDENFTNCTVLTIAHRLQTVKNCGKVLVVHQGMVQEFDDPNKLLENPDTFFSRMMRVLK